MNEQVEQLAAEVRNHDASTFDGEDSRDDVIQTLLQQELARLEEEADREAEASQKRSELRSKLGLSDPEELHVDEATDDVEALQSELQDDILGN